MKINQIVWWNGMNAAGGTRGYTPQWVRITGINGDEYHIMCLKNKGTTFIVSKSALQYHLKEWVDKYYIRQAFPRGVRFFLFEDVNDAVSLRCADLIEALGSERSAAIVRSLIDVPVMPWEVYKQYYMEEE